MNLDHNYYKKVETSDEENIFDLRHINREYYFHAQTENEYNNWLSSLKFSFSNLRFINDKDEIDYDNDPNRTHCLLIPYNQNH